ncbi:hypothetical protein DK843_00275 [Chromobacterium phragmitis]|uniref:Restriction endonuclease type IV Mrr domain-containing protein n=1 Tax=Chromobacterium phragmitis TaxID=2202141 RepID=A0A344UC77_9NEIS|nr:hypothetical protein DK843_00275 [Chromobacterium phragmitis]
MYGGFGVNPFGERGGSPCSGFVQQRQLFLGDECHLVQCKRWNAQKVGVAVVRELYGVMQSRGVERGFVVCSGEFTAVAKAFAAGKGIVLLPGKAVLARLREQEAGGEARGCPSCGCEIARR